MNFLFDTTAALDTHTIVPYIGECGHSFCKPCLDKWNKPCKPCGLGCPEVIADPQPNKTVIGKSC